MLPETAPTLNELSDFVTLELSDRGGHVGFVEGWPWQPKFWLELRIPAFFERRLRELEEPSVAIQVQREPERLSR
jgi:predicted alpha/beta-fold hydrolase